MVRWKMLLLGYTDILRFKDISVCMGIYPSISVEYPSVREYIRLFLSNIRLSRNNPHFSRKISVCTGITHNLKRKLRRNGYIAYKGYVRRCGNISVYV